MRSTELGTIHLVYPFYPHYRAEVFHALRDAGVVDRFTFGDSSSPLDPIALGDAAALEAVVLKNHWRGNLHLRQAGLLRDMRRSRAEWVVFLGGANSVAYWVAAIYARLLGKKVAFWTIGWHRPESGLKRRVRLTFYRLAHVLLLYADHGKRLGLAHGYPEDRMYVIGNSVGGGPVNLANRAGGRVAFGAVARLNERKRFDLLLRAVAELEKRGTAAEVLLAGEGEASEDLEKLAAELGVVLRMPGAIYDDSELASFYEQLTATVVPDAAGLTVIQSLRFGIPVVTQGELDSQMPEAAAVVPHVTGLHFSRGDSSALADALLECISWRDRVSDQAIAGSCHEELVKHWTPEASCGRILVALGLSS